MTEALLSEVHEADGFLCGPERAPRNAARSGAEHGRRRRHLGRRHDATVALPAFALPASAAASTDFTMLW